MSRLTARVTEALSPLTDVLHMRLWLSSVQVDLTSLLPKFTKPLLTEVQ